MIHNVADVTPAGVKTALKAARTPANWLMVSAPTGNAAPIRIGDSTTSATSGFLIAPGATFTLLPISDDAYLDLAGVFIFGTTTDKLSVMYGVR